MPSPIRLAVVLFAVALATPSFASPVPAQAARLSLGACSDDQTRVLSIAYAAAAKAADKGAAAAAATQLTSADPAFVQWFGLPTATTLATVRSTLASTQAYLRARDPLRVTCATTDDACVAAIAPQVGTRFGDALTVCRNFFRLPLEGENSQGVALLREITFFAGHTNDDTSTTTSAKALAKGNPPTALRSAANFAYYSALGYTP